MKSFMKVAATTAILSAATATAAFAENHGWAPEGPIKMLIAFAAGGGADTQGRLIADDIQAATGWEIVPEQVTGKGGVNALVALKDMPADGSAIALVVTESLGYNDDKEARTDHYGYIRSSRLTQYVRIPFTE